MEVSQETFVSGELHANLSSQLRLIQNKDIIVSDMGEEKVILSIQNGKYYNLGSLGGRIWELSNEPIMIGQVVNALLDEYDIDRSTCESEVYSFLTHLSEERLIQFSM